LLLVIHRREERKPTNTGKLAVECLVNSRVLVRGHSDSNDREFTLDPDRQSLLLFPSETARPLSEYVNDPRPITLIVPDGTWRQASKVRNRMPGLVEVPLVALPSGPPTTYRLRHESHEGGLATMEAIARAFGVLEGPSVQSELERVFRIMSERALWARGALDSSEVGDGLPERARRHDPMSGVDVSDS
jgi:DTW domain-containing protein YfiP